MEWKLWQSVSLHGSWEAHPDPLEELCALLTTYPSVLLCRHFLKYMKVHLLPDARYPEFFGNGFLVGVFAFPIKPALIRIPKEILRLF